VSKAFTPKESHAQPRPKEADGWRSGRPVEDPEKTKRWGRVSAKPSEYLVHVRRGQVTSSSGQGASCFKWPGDSVAVIPTSLQQLRFRADQVTIERIGVEVTGLAVYRIADPLIAYRVLNFSYPERAQEKLEETLTSMFIGAARRIIATLTVDDCLQRRKAMLGEELLSEVAPVVGGAGSPDDIAVRGWGVVLDTIEIQEVRVLSETVFRAMQAPYRTSLERRAREAKAEADKEITTREASCARAIEEVRINETLVVAERRRELQEREAAIAAEQAAQALRRAAELRRDEELIALSEAQAHAERAVQLEVLKQKEAEARVATHALLMEAAEKEAALQSALRLTSEAQARSEYALALEQGQAEAAVLRLKAEAQAIIDESAARVQLARNLPALAGAVGAKFGEVNITSYGDGAQNPFAHLSQAVGAVIDLVNGKTLSTSMATTPTTSSSGIKE
jgi:hypothetical protein